jgi:hypothetical protein
MGEMCGGDALSPPMNEERTRLAKRKSKQGDLTTNGTNENGFFCGWGLVSGMDPCNLWLKKRRVLRGVLGAGTRGAVD